MGTAKCEEYLALFHAGSVRTRRNAMVALCMPCLHLHLRGTWEGEQLHGMSDMACAAKDCAGAN